MQNRRLLTAFITALANLSSASAQIIGTEVDILSTGDDGYEGIPSGLAVIDVYVDVATTDAWTASGFQVFAREGATIQYFDQDPNTPGLQTGLINPGLANRYLTSLSRPRGRNANARFVNAAVATAGDYNEGGANPDISPNELDVAYFASPPMTPGSPSADGYIARIAVDVSQTGYDPSELVVAFTPQANAIVACIGTTQQWGFVNATFDVPQLNGFNFWVIPEPASLALWGVALGALRRGVRRFSIREANP